MVGFDQKDAYVGDEAQCKRGVLTLKYPIQQGIIANGDEFEKILHHIFYNELRVDPVEHPVLIMDSPLTPLKHREKMCQMLFETFLVPAVYQISTPVMAAYGNGMDTALIVEGNMSTTVVAPVICGCIDPGAVVILPFGEQDIVMFMQKLLTERGYSLTTTAERDIVRDIVRQTCRVNANPYAKNNTEKCCNYELPDGQTLQISSESHRALEPYFLTSLIGIECPTVVEAIIIATARSPVSQRKHLLQNILCVGNIKYKHFHKRVESELSRMLSHDIKTRVVQPLDGKYSAFQGGSSISDHYQFELFGITKDLYDTNGPSIVNRKCCNGGYSEKASGYKAEDLRCNTYEKMLEKAIANHVVDPKHEDAKLINSKKDSSVVAHQQVSNTNSLLVRVGRIICSSALRTTKTESGLPPILCTQCNSYVTQHNVSVCMHCKTSVDTLAAEYQRNRNQVPLATSNENMTEDLYVLKKGIQANESVPPKFDVPMVIFLLDVSGSMGTATKLTNGITIPTGYSTSQLMSRVSRLQLVQAAIRSKLLQMEEEQTNAMPVLITFGSQVNVYYPKTKIAKESSGFAIGDYCIPSSDMHARDYTRFIEQGVHLTKSFDLESAKTSTHTVIKDMVETLYNVRHNGCTALGPALALSNGIASKMPGSHIIVCTDGEANLGVGSIQKGDKSFYANMGELAIETATTINMITLEHCNSGLEYIGSASDLSNGSVSIADPSSMNNDFKLVGKNPIIATKVSCKILAGAGLTLKRGSSDEATSVEFNIGNITAVNGDLTVGLCAKPSLYNLATTTTLNSQGTAARMDDALEDAITPPPFVCPLTLEIMRDPVVLPDGFTYERNAITSWLSREHTTSPMTNKPFTALPVQITSNHTLREAINEWQRHRKGEQQGTQNESALRNESVATIQIQVRYTLSNGEERLHIINRSIPLTVQRDLAEKFIHPDVCALEALHKSAKLAQLGKYYESRMNLISTQRLLQRNLKSKSDCFAYMSFIGEAESLDQFMREKAMQEVVLNGVNGNALTADSSSRDDDASKNMYQSKSLTLTEFKSNVHKFS